MIQIRTINSQAKLFETFHKLIKFRIKLYTSYHFHPSIIFSGKAKAYLSGAPCGSLILPEDIRLRWKWVRVKTLQLIVIWN